MKRQIFTILLGMLILSYRIVAQSQDCLSTIVITPVKTNTMYVGVDNPIRISCSDIPADSLDIQITGGILLNKGKGNYEVRVVASGDVRIMASKKDKSCTATYNFRANRIPDPIPSLGSRYARSDTIPTRIFKAQMGISLLLENFDFAAKCDMVEFTVTRIPNTHTDGRAYRRAVKNVGVRFSSDSISLISEGEPGDTYVFSRIKGKCPGDLAERKLNDLVFFLDDRK